MKLKSQFLKRLSGLALINASRVWMSTLDYQITYYDPTCDVVHPHYRGPTVFAFWHEYVLAPVYLRPHSRLAMLVSRHEDAEIISQLGSYVGFRVVRGSSNRGGVGALKELFSHGQKMNLVITPDGPRGPRRKFAQGPVYLASKLGLPLVLWGFGHDRPWRTPTWDQFAIPRPYTRCRVVVGPAVNIPPDLDREGLEHYRQEMENLLNMLTTEAEQWAESGSRYEGQKFAHMQPSSRCRLDRLMLDPNKEPSDGSAHDDDAGPTTLRLTA